MIAFGPVPSRRLGRSLGINNIPPKICSYACVYCQLGRTPTMRVDRRTFYRPEKVLNAVRRKAAQIDAHSEASIDYLTFVPDGEPTLDLNLGPEIQLLGPLGLPVAVITNSSLIWRTDVRRELMGADWVSLKIDAVHEEIWRRVNRPHGMLELASILEGVREFGEVYRGELVTETMLVSGVNDGEEHLRGLARFLAELQPSLAYLAVPTRPPAEDWVRAPDEDSLNLAYQIVSEKVARVEILIGYEGNAFAFTGDVVEDLLAITAVHPMRQDAVDAFLVRAGAGWGAVRRLVEHEQLVQTAYGGHTFFLRKPRSRMTPLEDAYS